MVGGRSYNQSQLNRVDHRPAPARIGVQAVRLSRRVRACRRRGRSQRDARGARRRLADDVGVRRPGVDARELRERVRGRHHLSAGARPLAQRRHDQGRRAGRLRAGRRVVEAPERRHAAEGVSVDRARRVRSHAVRDRDRLHDVPEPRYREAAPPPRADRQRRRRGEAETAAPRRAESRPPTRRSSS